MSSHRRLSRVLTSTGLAVMIAALVAACGGSPKKTPPSSGAAGTAPGAPGAAAYRYSACMRTHGVTNFQDPQVHTHGNQVSVMIHVDPASTGSPAFKSAQQACGHLLPNGGNGGNGGNGPSVAQQHAREQAMLAFARCMRGHGFPKFPDPTAQGQLTLAMITGAGIDLKQPAVKPAAYACAPLTHGLMTRADINQAIANPNGSSAQSGSGAGG